MGTFAATPRARSVDAAGGRLRAGEGHLGVALVDGASTLTRCLAASPLQILAPRRRGRSASVVLATHGGGLVQGDAIELRVEVARGATCIVSTQAQTKVYRSEGGLATHHVSAAIDSAGALAFVPDAVSLFAGARYAQRQVFDLAAGASLLLVDGAVAGRAARGERWALAHYRSTNEVRIEGTLAFGDALVLAADGAGPPLAARLGPFEAFGLLVAMGPAFRRGATALAEEIAGRPVARDAPMLATASPLPDGLLVRCAAVSAEPLVAFLHAAASTAGEALGADAFPTRW